MKSSQFLSTGDPLAASTVACQEIAIPQAGPTDIVIKGELQRWIYSKQPQCRADDWLLDANRQ